MNKVEMNDRQTSTEILTKATNYDRPQLVETDVEEVKLPDPRIAELETELLELKIDALPLFEKLVGLTQWETRGAIDKMIIRLKA